MANTVIALKKSGTSSAVPSSLSNGEIAINYADGVLFYKHANGTIASITGGSTISFGTVNASGTLLIADQVNDVLDIRAGQNIIITGDAINDRLTINADMTAAYVFANGTANAANAYAATLIGGSVNVSTTGPTGNVNGTLWWNTDLGRLFIWYTDGDSNQWVEASPASGSVDVALLQSYSNATNTYVTSLASTKLANVSNTFYAGNFYIPDGFTLGIGSTDSIAPLTISKSGVSSVTLTGALIDADGTANSYLQAAIRNANTGAGASTDWIATTDDGTDSSNFIDLGINGSGFSSPTWTINGARDGYLYTDDSNLSIGSANSTSRTKYVNFFVGGTLSSNEAMRIQDSSAGPNVGIGITNPAYKLDVAGTIRGQASAVSGDVLIIGNDTKLVDIDVAHTAGLYSVTNTAIGSIKLGSGGGTISGNNSNIGINTSSPTSALEVNGLIKDSKGDVRDIPLNTQAALYALSLSDTGKVISTSANVFVPNAVFSSGHTVSIFNSSAVTINIIANSGVTFRLAGASNNANKLLAQNGVATIICVAANNFVLSGAGLS